MSVRCGHGHQHSSVAEVRNCYGAPAASQGPSAPTRPVADYHNTDESPRKTFTGSPNRPASEKQVNFISDLAAQTGETVHTDLMSSYEASQTIERLLKLKKSQATQGTPVKAANARVPFPDVPAGHYAVPSATGNNDLDFYRVDRPDSGAYAGRTFVKRVIGGRPNSRVRGAEMRSALERIVKAGPEQAGILYGREIGQCYRCNRTLTDDASRAAGIGPVCAGL